MIKYHKIQSVYLRDPATKHKSFLVGQFTLPVFEYLEHNIWEFTEKIDGTNVRVHWDGQRVTLGGRTADTQLHALLFAKLQDHFPAEKFAAIFPDATNVMLCGEGYGHKIQKVGPLYLPDSVDFIMFDVTYGGRYLERSNVEDVASKFGVGAVPVVGRGTLIDAINTVRAGFNSNLGDLPAEGLVVRPAVEMLDRQGHRVITKIKTRDFAN